MVKIKKVASVCQIRRPRCLLPVSRQVIVSRKVCVGSRTGEHTKWNATAIDRSSTKKMSQNLESNAYAANCSAEAPDSSSYGGFSSRSESTQVKTHSSLDQRALEHTENLQILLVQIGSAKQQRNGRIARCSRSTREGVCHMPQIRS